MGLFGGGNSSSSSSTISYNLVDTSTRTTAITDSFNKISSITKTFSPSFGASSVDSSARFLDAFNTTYSQPINIMIGAGKGYGLDLGSFFKVPQDPAALAAVNQSSGFFGGSGGQTNWLLYGAIGLAVLVGLVILKKKK